MKVIAICAVSGIVFASVLCGSESSAQARQFDIPREGAERSVPEFARQAGIQVLAPGDQLQGVTTPALKGTYDVFVALDLMLKGTDLKVSRSAKGIVWISLPRPKQREERDAMLPVHKNSASVLALVLSFLTSDWAHAQSATPAIANSDKANSLEMETVVVTGNAATLTKFDTSYAISTMSSDKMQELQPLSVMSLMTNVPGVWSEGTGGESSGNLFVRGLPSNGGEKFVPLLEDGLPVYQEEEVGFMNADTFIRPSPMIERAEFVRGGPAGVFYSNSSAGAFNFLNRRGTREWEGQIGATWADYAHLKLEGYVSGPINDKLSFVVGGYYRVDNGLRSPGYVANRGGELKTALTYKDGGTTASIYLYHLDDRTYFQTGLPFLTDTSNTHNLHPTPIPGLSLNSGTLASTDFQRVQLVTGNGIVNADLGNGIHSQFDTAGVEIFHDFGGGWKVEERARYTSGTNDFNGMFSGGTEKGSDVLSEISTGSNANPFWTRMLAAYPTTAHLKLVYHDDPTQIFDPINQNGNGLVAQQGWWRGLITASDFIDEVRLTKSVDAFGHHELAGGLYYSYASVRTQDNLNFGNLLTDTKNRPNVLDLVGVNASGATVGYYTYNGFTSFANYLNDVQDETTTYAFFLNDTWDVTEHLRLDFGVRHDYESIHTSFEAMTANDLRGSPMVNGNTALALASVGTLTGNYSHYSPHFDGTSWTVGANYNFDDQFGVFARYSRPQRLPRTEDGWVAGNRALQMTQTIETIEAGVKVSLPTFSAFVTVYQTDDLAYPNYNYTTNGVTGVQTPILFLATTRSRGVEFEALFRPWNGPFDVNIQGTYQHSVYQNFDQTFTTVDAFGNATTTHNNFSGHFIPHLPELMFQVSPSYHFNVMDHDAKLFFSYRFAAGRYLDNANTFRLPSFDEMSAGGYFAVTKSFRLQFEVQNLTNSDGMTEGGCSLCGDTGSLNALGSHANVYNGRPLFRRTFLLTGTYKF